MDPNATLAILRQTIKEFREAYDRLDSNSASVERDQVIDLGDTLAESAGALDDWLTVKRGFLPDDWFSPAYEG
jgi:hypothetical protein